MLFSVLMRALCLQWAFASAFNCPVRLLDLVPASESAEEIADTLQLSEDSLQYLAGLRSPLYVVPALGVYRGGKSLLLNRLMGLRAPYAHGFGVGHSQQTFTRGIDVCAEEVESLGTVVWMDTEGLFSSEEARSAYGPKIFSLALLFSSTVLLNSVKVLNDQFFAFFGEQQQLARVLRKGLQDEGLPGEILLPGNLSVVWILQQPISYDSGGEATRRQLQAFLNLPGDVERFRVKRDFSHIIHEVPVATNDFRLWSRLDQLADEEMVPEYLAAVDILRTRVLTELQTARPLQVASVPMLLRMYVELVQNRNFSSTLAKEAFEEAELGSLCDRFARVAEELAGSLPSATLEAALAEAVEETESLRAAKVEDYHLSEGWSQRLHRCLVGKREELLCRNGELVLALWTSEAGNVANQGECFFLGNLARLLHRYAEVYGQAFGKDIQARAVSYGSALQRTRLVECVRLRDLVTPFVPWLSWPLLSLYLWGGVASGVMTLVLHTVALSGFYHVLQMFNQLPVFLDLDYKVLQRSPILLDLAMRAPPLVPWADVARLCTCIGCLRLAWKVLGRLVESHRRPGQGFQESQLVNLELKLNMMLKRSEVLLKQQVATAALEASERLEKGEARGAARALLQGLCIVRNLGDSDQQLSVAIDVRLRRRISNLMDSCELPACKVTSQKRACTACAENTLVVTAARGDLDRLLEEMANILQILGQAEDGMSPSLSPSPVRSPVTTRRRAVASPGKACGNFYFETPSAGLQTASPPMSPSPLADTSTACETASQSDGIAAILDFEGQNTDDENEDEEDAELGSEEEEQEMHRPASVVIPIAVMVGSIAVMVGILSMADGLLPPAATN